MFETKSASRMRQLTLRLACATGLLFGGAVAAQDLRLAFEGVEVPYDSRTGQLLVEDEDDLPEASMTYIYIHGDQMRIDDGSGAAMLVRLSGEYPGFMILDPATGEAAYLPLEMVPAGDEMLTATEVVELSLMDVMSDEQLLDLEERFLQGTPPELTKGCLTEVAASCSLPVVLTLDGVTETVFVAASIRFGTISRSYAYLPETMEGLPPEMMGMLGGGGAGEAGPAEAPLRIRLNSDMVGRSTDQLPGYEILSGFYDALAMSVHSNVASGFTTMAAGLILAQAYSAIEGYPMFTQSWQQTKIEVSDELAMIRPMMDAIPTPASVSVATLFGLNLDPIEDPDSLFFGGGVPAGYTLTDLGELLGQGLR